MLFYNLMKPTLQVALRVFFRRIEIRHPDRLQEPGPLLMASNHPNTLMDPLVVAINRRQPIAFLAKSTFFKNPILRRVMESGNSIPIYRRQDADTQSGPVNAQELAARNEASFGRCYDYLDQGGTIMIFPEGNSISERRLRPLKTGAARIALGAEARHDFKLGLRVLPIGVNYFDPTRFRSDVFINVAPPIVVADYAVAYHQNPEAAADALTEEIRRRLERRLVITRDAAEDELVQQVERTFGDQLIPDDDPNTLYDNFQLSRTLLQAVAFFEKHDPEHLTEVREKLKQYLATLRQHQLSDASLTASRRAGESRWKHGIKTGLKLVLGAPVYVYGVINNYVPYILPSLAARRLTRELEFVAPIMLVTGMLTFSLGYAVQIALVHRFLSPGWPWTLLYALSLPVTGFYALSYWNNLSARLRRVRVWQLFRRQPAVVEGLMRQRAAIVQLLAEAREAYVAALAQPDKVV